MHQHDARRFIIITKRKIRNEIAGSETKQEHFCVSLFCGFSTCLASGSAAPCTVLSFRFDFLFQLREQEAYKLKYLFFNSTRFNFMNYSGFNSLFALRYHKITFLHSELWKGLKFRSLLCCSSFVDVYSCFWCHQPRNDNFSTHKADGIFNFVDTKRSLQLFKLLKVFLIARILTIKLNESHMNKWI